MMNFSKHTLTFKGLRFKCKLQMYMYYSDCYYTKYVIQNKSFSDTMHLIH